MSKLISHSENPQNLDLITKKIKDRIQRQGDKPYCSAERQLELLEQLSEFDFGQYLLQNQGINGYWTHYMLTHPWHGRKTKKNNREKPFSELETFILDRAPTLVATQQRFEIFLKENQKAVKDNAKLACIPSGMLGELLYLDYSHINNIQLIGVDYDANTLNDAKKLAELRSLSKYISLIQKDAWQLSFTNELDLISSNGLNIYEPDDNKVTDLYSRFYNALKNGGKLVTSFLTPPPSSATTCEWDMSVINQNDLLLQKIIFVDIIDAKWQCFRSSELTRLQLEAAGFKDINFIYDTARMFPTVVAYK